MEPSGWKKENERRQNALPPFCISHGTQKSSFFHSWLSILVGSFTYRQREREKIIILFGIIQIHIKIHSYVYGWWLCSFFSAVRAIDEIAKALFAIDMRVCMCFCARLTSDHRLTFISIFIKLQKHNVRTALFFFVFNHNHLIAVDWSVYLAYLWPFSHAMHTWHAVHSKCGIVLANVGIKHWMVWTNSIAFTFCQWIDLCVVGCRFDANLICEVKNINEYSLTCVNWLIKWIGKKRTIFP